MQDTPPTQSDPTGQPSGPQSPEETVPTGLLEFLGVDDYEQLANQVLAWAQANLLVWNSAIQLGLLAAAFVPAIFFAPSLSRLINDQITKRVPDGILKRLASALTKIAVPLALYITLSILIAIMGAVGQKVHFMETGRSLLTAWILVRLVTLVIRSPFWSKVAFYTIWPIMALDAFHVLDDVIAQLDAMSIPLGEGPTDAPEDDVTLSLLDVVRAGIIFAIFFSIANLAGNFATRRINQVDELNPSLKAMFAKLLNLALPIVALLLALNFVGFDLTSLAIFSGAVGIGVGLGLQKVISNFAAGMTLLADRSIKPGDTIEVGETFGWVTAMNARYVAVRTRDGTEHLVPNDEFVNNGVINWSHDDRVVRLHAPFGITYKHRDVRAVQKMAEEAALTVDRVLKSPKPRCNLVEFGDSSVNFDLRFWINDPPNGITNVRSDVMMAVWDMLHEHDIEVPFPQRDLHIKSSDVALEKLVATTPTNGIDSEPSSERKEP